MFIGTLPDSYSEFCKAWLKYFPVNYCTKHMCKFFDKKVVKKTGVETLFTDCHTKKQLKDNVIIELSEGYESYSTAEADGKAHEAGYDAYMTGYIFATLMKYKEIGLFLEKVQSQGEKRTKQKKQKKKKRGKEPIEDVQMTDPEEESKEQPEEETLGMWTQLQHEKINLHDEEIEKISNVIHFDFNGRVWPINPEYDDNIYQDDLVDVWFRK